MTDQIIPITGLADTGVIYDMPPVSLPPNAFTDVKNVRFRHGSVEKMSGEKVISRLTPTQLGVPNGEFIFITDWNTPTQGDSNSYYIMVVRDSGANTDHIIMVRALPADLDNPEYNEVGTTTASGTWQSTIFQGGFAIILNNGIDVPYYMMDSGDGTVFADFELYNLPGWDSYLSFDPALEININIDVNNTEYSLGRIVDFATHEIFVKMVDETGSFVYSGTAVGVGTVQYGGANAFTIAYDTTTNTHKIVPEYTGINSVQDEYNISVWVRSVDEVAVRAGIIKAYGDFLIAGDLRYVDPLTLVVQQELAGLVRTSSIAGPGSLPNNWNPYEIGNNTADEIQLATSGIVRDMVPLQNQMIIYTGKSIHALQLTNNPAAPFAVQNLTDSYGAITLDSVIEYDGRHLVVGNNDIYLFGGHPGSIQSVAENKVRDFFYKDVDRVNISKMFLFRNVSKDEIWINYPSNGNEYANKTLIFNYRTGTWTLRQISEMRSGFSGRISSTTRLQGGDANTGPANTEIPIDNFTETFDGGATATEAVTGSAILGDDATPDDYDTARKYPIFCDDTNVYYAEADNTYTDHYDNTYESYVCRVELPITPEFDTEHLKSTAMWVSREVESDIPLYVYACTHDKPTGDRNKLIPITPFEFTIGKDYKVDIHKNGRFFNYKITDKKTGASGVALGWSLSGLQHKIGKRGSR